MGKEDVKRRKKKKKIDTHTKKWLANHLTGRHAYTLCNDKPSTTKRYTNGVPQGSVLSPTLFKFYIHEIPLPTHHDTQKLSHVDDITVFSQHPDHKIAVKHL